MNKLHNKIKDIIDSNPNDTTDKGIEKEPIFNESMKQSNTATVEPNQDIPLIKATNAHETEILKGADELTQNAKLQNLENKEQEDTTEEEAKTKEGSLKL